MGRRSREFPLLFLEKVKEPLRESVYLGDYSNFRIGGKADYFFEAHSFSKLKKAIFLAREFSIPYYIIGGGYNILFDDEGFRGLIIKNEAKGLELKSKFGDRIEVLSGTSLASLVKSSMEASLAGLEFLAGIPGSVGGAVFGNAGAFGQSIGNFLKEAVLLDDSGNEVEVKNDYFEFRYRESLLRKKHDILLKAVFELEKGDKEKIKAQIGENLEKRKRKHPPEHTACAGSYFKNPIQPDGGRIPAGYLLEKVGAKNLRIGGAAVYSGHANFIINVEKASAKDVLRLAQELKERVKEKFGLELQEEVIFLPAEAGEL